MENESACAPVFTESEGPPTLHVDLDSMDLGKRKAFFISDLHLGHLNIIRYCSRPFRSLPEMDDALISNWNRVVGRDDIVFYLGDLAYGSRGLTPASYMRLLKGNVYFIKGNHDRRKDLPIPMYSSITLSCRGTGFILVHNPDNWMVHHKRGSWLVHGHHHNNKPEFPVVDMEKKTINVSCELIDYTPISLEELLEMMK